MSVQQAMQRAIQNHQAGRLADADVFYRQVLAGQPENADALHLLGVLASQSGRHDEAIGLISKALDLNPQVPEFYFNLGIALEESNKVDQAIAAFGKGLSLKPNDPRALTSLANALRKAGRTSEAIAACQRALTLQPHSAETYNNLGGALHMAGRLDEAASAFQKAISLRPANPQAHGNLGAAMLQRGRLDEAIAAFSQALRLSPEFADAHSNLGLAHLLRGDLDDAVSSLRRALELRPNFAEALYNLASAYNKKGNWEQAVACYRQSAALRPATPDLLTNLGSALHQTGQFDEAITTFQQAINLKPDFACAWNSLSVTLSETGQLDQAVAAARRALSIAQDTTPALANLSGQLFAAGELEEAIARSRDAMTQRPNDPAIASNHLFMLQYHPGFEPQDILAEHRDWDRRFGRPLAKFIQPREIDPHPRRRLRIGYVSGDFRNHVVGWNLLPLLKEHDHEQFEIFCYSNTARPDDHTRQIKACADTWRDITRIDDAAACDMIRADAIDILVDLSLHMAGNRLPVFARKPAPVQLTYLGYAGTTGLSAMDYRFSDPHLDPFEGDLLNYSEKTLRLPTTYWCYQPGGATPEPGPSPAEKNGYVTFGCLANFAKVSGQALDLWAEIMREVPHSHLLLNCPAGDARRRVQLRLAAYGIAIDRIEFTHRQNWDGYIRTYHRIDIALDPFPYAGGITTCDSLWMGVPVITLAGRIAVGRGGCTILENIGLADAIALTPRHYKILAADCNRWIGLRDSLRQKMIESPLMNARQFAQDVQGAYRKAWREKTGL
ncbi:MAG: tetratricopeptide repeat protein [Tepidisphaeraceae bacterium]|jgi:predicted O-linked N-acetylglucosamine transferase (SPINDLY family)